MYKIFGSGINKMHTFGYVPKILMLLLMCFINRGHLNEVNEQSTLVSSHSYEQGAFLEISAVDYGLGGMNLVRRYKRWNAPEQAFRRENHKRSTNMFSSSRPFSSTQRSDVQNVRIKSHFKQVDALQSGEDEWNNATKSEGRILSVRRGLNLANSSYQQPNVSASINMTLLNKYAKSLIRRRDMKSAALCLSAVLILLFAVVLHSRMWQRKNHWRTLDDVLDEQDANSELPQHGKVSLKDLIDRKIAIIKTHFRRIPNRSRHSPKRGQYKEMKKTEISGTETVYS